MCLPEGFLGSLFGKLVMQTISNSPVVGPAGHAPMVFVVEGYCDTVWVCGVVDVGVVTTHAYRVVVRLTRVVKIDAVMTSR